MIALALPHAFVAAAGYSILYMLCGGGLGVAILIFVIAKLMGR